MAKKSTSNNTILARVNEDTPSKVQAIAQKLGYTYAKKGSIGKLLNAIAEGKLVLMNFSDAVKTDKQNTGQSD